MKYDEFLIEVKTPWSKKDANYERMVIRYNCIPSDICDKPIFAFHYLNEIETKKEITTEQTDEGLLVHAIDAKTYEEIDSKSKFISCLINYTLSQWSYEG